MLDHVTIAVSDFTRSREFYDAALAPLGIFRLYADGDHAAGYGSGSKAIFWIAEQVRTPGQAHIAFKARQPTDIQAFYAAALAHGGRDNGPPGTRPQYHDRYYAAFVIDPDGYNIEAVIQ